MKNVILREEIPKMYLEDKLSTKEIGRIVGLTCGAIGSILKTRGIKLRSPKEGLAIKYPNGRAGNLAANWRGGKRKVSNKRYIHLFKPDHPHATKQGYVMEHRVVMEKQLGRLLKSSECVHHINGDTFDNRIENLKLMTRSEHVQLHFDAIKEVERLKKILDEHGIKY